MPDTMIDALTAASPLRRQGGSSSMVLVQPLQFVSGTLTALPRVLLRALLPCPPPRAGAGAAGLVLARLCITRDSMRSAGAWRHLATMHSWTREKRVPEILDLRSSQSSNAQPPSQPLDRCARRKQSSSSCAAATPRGCTPCWTPGCIPRTHTPSRDATTPRHAPHTARGAGRLPNSGDRSHAQHTDTA